MFAMTRGLTLGLSVGLIILWIMGITSHANIWLTWLNGLAALVGFAVVFGAGNIARDSISPAGPIAIGVGLALMWIVGLATGANTGLTWLTFVFACAFVFVGIGASVSQRQATRQKPHAV
jgi:hypothetical protein